MPQVASAMSPTSPSLTQRVSVMKTEWPASSLTLISAWRVCWVTVHKCVRAWVPCLSLCLIQGVVTPRGEGSFYIV